MNWNQAIRRTIVILPALILLGAAQPEATDLEPQGDPVELLHAELEQVRLDLAAATEKATAAQLDAKSEKQRADAYRSMFTTVIGTLSSEKKRKQRDASARELLDKVAARYKKSQRRLDEKLQARLQHAIAGLYHRIEVYDEAIAFGRLAVAGREASLGEDNRYTLGSMAALASALDASGDRDEAILVARERLVRSERGFGPDHIWTKPALIALCEYLYHGRRFEEAVPRLGTLGERLLAKDSSRDRKSAAFYLSWRAEALQVLGRYSEAEQLLRELVELHLSEYGPDHRNTFDVTCRLAWVLRLRGHTEEPDRLELEFTELAEFMEAVYRPFWSTTYAGYLDFLGQDERVEMCLVGILERNQRFGYKGRQLDEHIQPLVEFYEARGKAEEAARYRAMLWPPGPPPTGPE